MGGIGFSPLGETGEGFVCWLICRFPNKQVKFCHVNKKYRYWTKSHKRKTGARKRTPPQNDSRRENIMERIASQ
jgi:hypothetical protein